MIVEINIFDTQAQTFHQAQPTAIEKLGHEFGCALHVADDRQSLLLTEDGGQAAGFLGANEFGREGEFAAENVAVEKDNCAQGLIL